MTNISELVEYVLLPHNDEVIKPRALNTFLDGLAELGVDKRLIKNKRILSDLLEKEKVYRENEGEGDDDSDLSDISDSSDGEESHSKSNGVEVIASLTKKESFRKSRRNHVIIVKIGICP